MTKEWQEASNEYMKVCARIWEISKRFSAH